MATTSRVVPKSSTYRIAGRVLVRDSNAGIPDLVVAFFNADLARTPAGETWKSAELSRQLVNQLRGRLGSVLTDRNGGFELVFPADASASKAGGIPDIVVVVFAPEDSGSFEAPVPKPVEERVLHISRSPRMDIGRAEAYVIRIPQTHLDQFGISAGPAAGYGARATRDLQSAMERGWDLRDQLRERLGPRLKAEQQKHDEYAARAAKAVQSLSAIPRHRRDPKVQAKDFYLADRSMLAANLRQMQFDIINEGLAGLGRAGRKQPTLRLHLTVEELSELGLKITNGVINGTPDSAKLASKARRLSGGNDLIKVRGMRNPGPDELERKYLSPTKAKPSKPVA